MSVTQVATETETNESVETFTASELSPGTAYTYYNSGRLCSGMVGEVRSHNQETTHVVYDSSGAEVCVIGGEAPKLVQGNGSVIIPVGERTIFAYQLA